VQDYGVIRVGDVSSTKLAKTKMAKSALDSGWGMLRSQLAYKSSRAQVDYAVVPERHTSQMCSCCGVIPRSSPKGMGALGIRHWQCSDCGASHDRDVNAARNILAVGREHPPLVEEIPALQVEGRC
jgi:putative transposase